MLSDRPSYASLDAELRFVAVNDRLLKFLGASREELIGRGLTEVYPQANGSELHNLMLEAQASMQPIRKRAFSEPLRTWLEVEVHPIGGGVQVAFTPVDGPEH